MQHITFELEEKGEHKGLRKAEMLIRLMYSSVDGFSESILQESLEAQELRKIFTGGKNRSE